MDPAFDPHAIFRASPTAESLLRLFDLIPDAYFYAKDRDSRFVRMNAALLRLRGLRDMTQVLGLTDLDLHPLHWARQYIDEDRQVMDTGEEIVNRAWLVPDHQGRLRWFLSSKVPLRDAAGAVIGIAGVMRDYERTDELVQPFRQLEQVLAFVAKHYGQRITIQQLATLAQLSVSQLDRRFKSLFQMTPQQYLTRVRIHEACRRLVESDRSLSDIALETGFYDQAHFARTFRGTMRTTPLAYRRAGRAG